MYFLLASLILSIFVIGIDCLNTPAPSYDITQRQQIVNKKATPMMRLKLFQNLMQNYSKNVRLQSAATLVTLDPAIYSIVDVNEARESIVIAQWFETKWIDSQLSWDPKKYGGITRMRITQDMVWKPDITIYELLESMRQGEPESSYVSITFNGTVFLSRTEQVTVHCAFDVGDFPHDKQNCTMTYVTWAYPDDEIVLVPAASPHARDQFFQISPVSEWRLLSYLCYRHLRFYGPNVGYWYEISYHLHIERKPFYYMITLAIPSFLITTLALIGVFSPSQADQDRSEKVSIGLTALLTMAVVLMMVSELMPKNATRFPKLGSFILFEMCFLVGSTIVAVAVMYIHSRAHFGKRIPVFIRNMIRRNQRHNRDDLSSDDDDLSVDIYANNSKDIVGEKLANYTDTVNNFNSSYIKMQLRMNTLVREVISVNRQIFAFVENLHLESERRRMRKEDWTVFCHYLDFLLLTIAVTTNTAVAYWLYMF